MTTHDIPQVMHVNRQCFPAPWSAWAIKFDVEKNPNSLWVIVEEHLQPGMTRQGWLSRLFNPLALQTQIFGFGGFWLMRGEAHITNIGIDPIYQGHGWGEVLLLSMLKQAVILGARFSSLEVRISNHLALNLYRKYHYQVVGRKLAYYHDNHEDAHAMATQTFDLRYHQMLAHHEELLMQRLQWHDWFVRSLNYET